MSISKARASRKARPLLFSAPMVRALLEGRKTQTRRIIKPEPIWDGEWFKWQTPKFDFKSSCEDGMAIALKHTCPYGKPGDLLWVRETTVTDHATSETLTLAKYAAGGDPVLYPSPTEDEHGEPDYGGSHAHWWYSKEACPSIHMPRWASRLTLELTDVRVERLKDISEADAKAEGATSKPKCSGFCSQDDGWSMDWSSVGTCSRWGTNGILTEHDICLGSAKSAFGGFINLLHGGKNWNCRPETPIWDQNPWVWALSFNVHQCNVDEFLKREVA